MSVDANRKPVIRENAQLQKYYASLESRLGYRLFLGGSRHFGYYDSEHASPFPLGRALRRMEDCFFDELDLPPDSEVLDCGCGVGHVAIRLAQRGLRVQGIDIVKKHVTKARANVRKTNLEDRVGIQEMDYHDLSTLESGRFDGLYTSETFVHSTDPPMALAEFYRVLKPGGKLDMHEYDHPPVESMPAHIRKSLEDVNDLSAMPGCQMFEPGVLPNLLREAGFVDVQVNDLSKNIMPMLWLFFLFAIIPYYIIKFFRLEKYFVNTLAGARGYMAMKRGYCRYLVVTARKPMPGEEAGSVATPGAEAKKTR